MGAWSGGYASNHQMPHAKMLPIGGMTWARVEGLHYFDIFADGAEQKIDQAFSATLPLYKDDPSIRLSLVDTHIPLIVPPMLGAGKGYPIQGLSESAIRRDEK